MALLTTPDERIVVDRLLTSPKLISVTAVAYSQKNKGSVSRA
ncbi:hypothetical protein [Nonomuraea sp. NPDC049158]